MFRPLKGHHQAKNTCLKRKKNKRMFYPDDGLAKVFVEGVQAELLEASLNKEVNK